MERNVPKLRFKGFNDEWEEKKLGSMGKALIGLTYSPDNISDKENGLLVLRSSNIKDGHLNYNDNVYVNMPVKDDIRVRKNDILLCSRNGSKALIGKSALIDSDINATFGAFMTVIRANNGKFINQLINTREFFRQINMNLGATINQITSSNLNNFKFKVPSHQEQERIANFLTKVDKIIEKQEEKVKNLEKYKKGMMQKIFSQEIRFKDENGNEYPEWEEKKLKDVVSGFEYGMNSSAIEFDGINKYIRITDIDESSNKYRNENIVSPDGILEDKYLVKENDILFARTGASVGKTYLYDKNDGKVYFAGFLIRANVNRNNNSKFIFMQTQTDEYKRWVKIMSMRSGQPGINSQEYATYNINIPCIEEQNRIAKFLTNIDDIIEKENKKLIQMRYLKKGLLQQMFV